MFLLCTDLHHAMVLRHALKMVVLICGCNKRTQIMPKPPKQTSLQDQRLGALSSPVYPEDSDDHHRWILGFVRQLKGSEGSLHNHNVHASSHLLTKTQEDKVLL